MNDNDINNNKKNQNEIQDIVDEIIKNQPKNKSFAQYITKENMTALEYENAVKLFDKDKILSNSINITKITNKSNNQDKKD